jgi:hypothetical protein
MDDEAWANRSHSFCFGCNPIALYRNLYKIRISQESISVSRMLFAPLQLLPECPAKTVVPHFSKIKRLYHFHYLVQTESSAAGWRHRSNFKSLYVKVIGALHLASLFKIFQRHVTVVFRKATNF